MGNKKIQRRVTRIETRPQYGLFEGDAALAQPPRPPRARSDVRFVDPDPGDIRFGVQRLDEHLRGMGLRDGRVVRALLAGRDWSAFEAHYSAEGRPAYAPRLMAGIVLFGLLRGVSSLRELERLARSDLECMWVSGGITPDHSVLGRFVQRHEAELAEGFFRQVTAEVLRRTGSHTKRLAGDGTTIEAMSSRFALLKREAAQAACEQVRAADREETDPQRAQLERACAVLNERPQAKAIVPAESEAGLLKLKGGRGSRPAYEGAVLANEARVVVDAEVHSTSEQAALGALLDRLEGNETQELLLDAGFNTYEVLETTLGKEISLLCPERSETPKGGGAQSYIALREFRYVEDGDYYVCPAGEQLRFWRRSAGNAAQGRRPYAQYVTTGCRACGLRSRCTRGPRRVIQRTEGQELKEALRTVMQQPQAKRIFARRKAMVEPVFAQLRERHRLNRFRRRGLRGARLEFRLHVIAYNIGRVLAYAKRRARQGAKGQFFGRLQALCKRLWIITRRRDDVRGLGPQPHGAPYAIV